MTWLHRGRIRCLALAASVFGTVGVGGLSAATPTITYYALGAFDTVPQSGNDVFRLAGEPFSITIDANDSQLSSFHGPTYAGYTYLEMIGTIHSALLPTPITISNRTSWIVMANGNPSYDLFVLGTQLKIIGLTLKISANLTLPEGSLTTVRNHAFSNITLTPDMATMTYTDGTTSTTLGISGMIYGSSGTAAASTGVPAVLYAAGARAVTAHADGTQSEQSIQAAPVNLGASSDVVALRFYAAGIGDASGVRVQIAGQDVPVLYAGRSGHFPGLDEVSVQVPRSLAGSGEVDVILQVSGQAAQPVRVRVQ